MDSKRSFWWMALIALLMGVEKVLSFFYKMLEAFVYPPKPQPPRRREVKGYWWRDRKGVWHPRVYMYSRDEAPPSSTG